MLLSVASPLVNLRFVSIFEREQKVLAIAEELVCTSPAFQTETSKLPSELIFNNNYCSIILFCLLEKRNQTAAMSVHVEQTFPFTSAVVAWQLANQIAHLYVAQDA